MNHVYFQVKIAISSFLSLQIFYFIFFEFAQKMFLFWLYIKYYDE